MMLRRLPFQNAVVAADVIVMPRSCSCSISPSSRHLRALRRFCGSCRYNKGCARGRGLAGIDMRHDTEVAVVLYGMKRGAWLFLKFRSFRRYQR